MDKQITLKGRYRHLGEQTYETLQLSLPQTAFLLVDVYYDNQARGDWGDPSEPFVPHFKKMEACVANALEAARQVDIRVIYAMNSAPRIGLQKSAFGAHFARCWSADGSAHTFDRVFAEGGMDAREYHKGPDGPLKIAPGLAPRVEDLYIRKHVYSAFFDSRLDTALRNHGVNTLVCSGLWANVCMASTALDALYRNYRVIWLRDGTLAGEDPKEDLNSLPNTARWITWFEEVIGFTVISDEFVEACQQAAG